MTLFICNTIFQLYFAKKIVKNLNISDFDLIFIGEINSRKNINYFNETAKLAKNSIVLNCNKKTILFSLDIRKKIKKNNYHTVYLSSIDSIYTQLILSYLNFSNLYTFDDGSANINPKSSYYIDNRCAINKIIYYAIGNTFSISKIKKKSKAHYSIYREKNIINNVIHIDIFEKSNLEGKKNNSCNLILGTVYNEVLLDIKFKDILFDNLKSLIASFDGDVLYLPHPRDLERLKQFKNEYLSTELIFEDIYSDLALKYKKINIFSFCSSSIFNLSLNNSYIIKGNIFNQYYSNLVNYVSQTTSPHCIEINK